MKCAKIVIYLIISEICSAAGDISNQLAITDGPSTKIQSCVAKIIEHVLNPSESMTFVISAHPDYIPSGLPNPVTVVDVRVPLPTYYKRYGVNFVIEAENHSLFVETMQIITRSHLWHPRESPKGKFVILVNEEEALEMIFYEMWRQIFALHIIVVIYEDTSKNRPMKIITSNPQAEGNNCSGIPTVFSNFSCDNISSLEFLKPIRNYNGCPVFFHPHGYLLELDLNKKKDRIKYNLFADLKRRLNVTPIFLFGNSRKMAEELFHYKEIAMSEYFFGIHFHEFENSIIFSRKLFLWMGPHPTPISTLNTVFLPFKCDLWLAVLFIMMMIVLVKWMIIKGNGNNNNCVNLACAFSDIIGLTFGVSVNRIPNIWSLKLLLGFFLIYMIHIHTVYTSDLINILTVPRYEGVIKNLEDVAASGLPVVMPNYIAAYYFQNVTNGGSLFGKINKLIIPITGENVQSIQKMKRFSVYDEDNVVQKSGSKVSSRFLRKNVTNMFLTNDISGEIKEVFILQNGSYFTTSLNAVITHLWESGTFEVDAQLNPNLHNVKVKKPASVWNTNLENEKNIVRPLRLKDLLPIFVIVLICLSFSIIIFAAEILVHKITA